MSERYEKKEWENREKAKQCLRKTCTYTIGEGVSKASQGARKRERERTKRCHSRCCLSHARPLQSFHSLPCHCTRVVTFGEHAKIQFALTGGGGFSLILSGAIRDVDTGEFRGLTPPPLLSFISCYQPWTPPHTQKKIPLYNAIECDHMVKILDTWYLIRTIHI